MAETLFMAHSGLRYLVLLAAIVAAAAAAMSLRPGTLSRAAETTGKAFLILLDIQVLLGLVLLLVWPFHGQLIGHIVMMLLAIIVAHGLSVRLRRRPPEARSPRVQLAAVLVPLALIVGGILAIGRSVV